MRGAVRAILAIGVTCLVTGSSVGSMPLRTWPKTRTLPASPCFSSALMAPPAVTSFDATTFELWCPQLTGGRVAPVPPGPLDPRELARLVRRAVEGDRRGIRLELTPKGSEALDRAEVDRGLDELLAQGLTERLDPGFHVGAPVGRHIGADHHRFRGLTGGDGCGLRDDEDGRQQDEQDLRVLHRFLLDIGRDQEIRRRPAQTF